MAAFTLASGAGPWPIGAVTTAIAREMVGFLWAIARHVEFKPAV